MKIAMLFASTVLLFQQGCDHPAAKVPPQPRPERPPIHRFENVPTVGPSGVALDTVTGQWCRTWDWVPRDPKAPTDGLSTIPTCLSLYEWTAVQPDAASK